MRIFDLLEGDVIDFATGKILQKGSKYILPPDEDFSTHNQMEMEDYIRDRLIQERDISIKKQKSLALPTIMSMYNKFVKPSYAWAIQLDDTYHSKLRDTKSLWIYYHGKEIIDDLIEAAKDDAKRIENIKKEIKNVPHPDRIKEIVDRDLRDSKQAVKLLTMFKNNVKKGP